MEYTHFDTGFMENFLMKIVLLRFTLWHYPVCVLNPLLQRCGFFYHAWIYSQMLRSFFLKDFPVSSALTGNQKLPSFIP